LLLLFVELKIQDSSRASVTFDYITARERREVTGGMYDGNMQEGALILPILTS
jgi:hypothetical protein